MRTKKIAPTLHILHCIAHYTGYMQMHRDPRKYITTPSRIFIVMCFGCKMGFWQNNKAEHRIGILFKFDKNNRISHMYIYIYIYPFLH